MSAHQKKSPPPYAIVIGLDHYLGLQTARIFKQRGVPVIGIAKDPQHFACRTNVCEKILYADILGQGLIDALVSLGKKLAQKAVLVPCRDMSVLLLSRNRAALAPYFHYALPEADTVEMLMDKLSFYEFARREQLPIADYRLIYSRSEALAASRELNFPCILKPPMKSPQWEAHTTHKAFKVFSSEEFMELYDRYACYTEVLMAQEWITGGDANNYSCNCYYDEKSQPLVAFTAKKLRQWPTETGSTSLGVECRSEEVRETALRLFKKVNFRGLGYLEMKRDERSGKYLIIEPNIGRPTGRSAIVEAGGVELLFTMYCDLVGWSLPPNRQQQYTGVKWVYLRQDLQSAFHYWRRGELSLAGWWRSLRGPKFFAVFAWYDLRPFLEDVRARTVANFGAAMRRFFQRSPVKSAPASAGPSKQSRETAVRPSPKKTVTAKSS